MSQDFTIFQLIYPINFRGTRSSAKSYSWQLKWLVYCIKFKGIATDVKNIIALKSKEFVLLLQHNQNIGKFGTNMCKTLLATQWWAFNWNLISIGELFYVWLKKMWKVKDADLYCFVIPNSASHWTLFVDRIPRLKENERIMSFLQNSQSASVIMTSLAV